MTVVNDLAAHDYGRILEEYVDTHSEAALYRASLLSRALLESGLGPEDIIALHVDMLERVRAGLPTRRHTRVLGDAHQFLLEIMIAYGVHYKEYLEFRLSDSIRDAEARLAREHEHVLEAERIGREKSEILSVIAHELRTPITAATSFIELAQISLSRGLTNKVPAHLGSAREALDRLSRLSGDLVEASHDEMPRLAFSPLDLNDSVAQACAWARPAATGKDLALDCDLSPDRLIVQGNSDGLLSVFGNLVSNAVHYTAPGGRISIRSFVEGTNAVVEFTDTGIGIPPELLEKIFEKFYRAPHARQLAARGLGLGLSLVRQLVLAHNGDVIVESEPGRGSTFRVVLPLGSAN